METLFQRKSKKVSPINIKSQYEHQDKDISSLNFLPNSPKSPASSLRFKSAVFKVIEEKILHDDDRKKDKDPLENFPILKRTSNWVRLPGDTKSDLKRKGSFVVIGIASIIGGLIFSIETTHLYSTNSNLNYFILLPLLFTFACILSLLHFLHYKQPNVFGKNILLLLFIFPHLFQIGLKETNFSTSLTLSIWSFLSPFGAIVYFPDSAVHWFLAFLTSHLLMIPIESYIHNNNDNNNNNENNNNNNNNDNNNNYNTVSILQSSFHTVNLLLLLSLLFMALRYHVTSLKNSKRKLHMTNDYLRSHNKELLGEKDLLKEEVVKLQKERNIPDISIDSQSKAEKMIKIMQKLKQTGTLNSFEDDINFVISTLGTGRDLYIPDMTEVLGKHSNSYMDSNLKSFILSHQVCDHLNHHHTHHHHHDHDHDHTHVHKHGHADHDHDNEEHEHKHDCDAVNSSALCASTSGSLLHSEEANAIFLKLNDWNFSILEFAALTERPLYYIGRALFRKHNLIKKFNINKNNLDNFLNAVEDGYKKQNPYHNNIHASDVAQTLNFFMTNGGIKKYLTDVDIFAGIVAALVHDIDHPGVNNNFEVVTNSQRALLHNDLSVLENHHLSTAFFILKNESNNIFSGVSHDTTKEIRSTIIEMVLATDFSKHFEVLGQFKSRRAAGEFSENRREDRILLLKMALKCADISHTSKESSLHLKWTERVTEEFYLQGDKEKAFGLPISAFMDRGSANVPKSQTGFISFLVLPLYEAFVNEFPESTACLDQLQKNLDSWKSQMVS